MILPALTEAEGKFYRAIKYSLFPPLGLAQLAGYFRLDDEIEIMDLHVEKGDFSDDADLVVIQIYITNAFKAYEIADMYRKRGVFVAVGGLHATSLPEEALRHADAVFCGPAHKCWGDFIREFRNGRKMRGIFSDEVRSLDEIPAVRRDLIDRRKYLVPNSMVVSRGCPCRCDFCYTRNFFAGGKSFYTAQIDRILSEIEKMPGRHLFFLDDNLFGSEKFASALFDGMKGMNRRFQAAATVSGVLNSRLLDLAAEAGLRSLFVGFESLNQESLLNCNKKQNNTGLYNNVIAGLRSRNIMTNASFVFGLDGDTGDVFDRTVEWAVSQGIETATFHLATPYPGTPFFDKLKSEKRIVTENWDLYDTRHAVIRHSEMSGEELENGYWASYRNFYSWSNIFRSAGVKEEFNRKLKHLFYTSAWKKFDPLWKIIIRLKTLPVCSSVLEKVLDMQ